jgi:hypothetical protein
MDHPDAFCGLDHNPYPLGTVEAETWDVGFEDAYQAYFSTWE